MELSELKNGLELKYVYGRRDLYYGKVIEKDDIFEIIWDDGETSEISKTEPTEHQLEILHNCKLEDYSGLVSCYYKDQKFNIKSILFDDLNKISHVILVNDENETKLICGSELHILKMKLTLGQIK